MDCNSFRTLCISHIADGLADGLSHFSLPSRVALLYAINPDDPVRVYDPHNLLSGHEPKLKKLYLDSDSWREDQLTQDTAPYEVVRWKDFELAGLITCAGRSSSVFYQQWFTEHHPGICSPGPIQCWLEHAVGLLAQDFASQNVMRIDSSGRVLQEYATHAVRDYIVDTRIQQMGMDTQLRIYPALDAILAVSTTTEEGVLPRGELVFVEPSEALSLNYVALFPENERPLLSDRRHVRKLLLAVDRTQRKLISDGTHVLGFAIGSMSESSLAAEFFGRYGFLRLGGKLIASFTGGRFNASSRKPNLVQFEELLLEYDMPQWTRFDLLDIFESIVGFSLTDGFGCTIVLDMNEKLLPVSGQQLAEPLDLTEGRNLRLARSLAHIDGALQIGLDLRLHRFSCLLDGLAVAGENRARGARYNSALRFSAHHPNVIVVVVSSDRPISVLHHGVEVSSHCSLPNTFNCILTPPVLEEWLDEQGAEL